MQITISTSVKLYLVLFFNVQAHLIDVPSINGAGFVNHASNRRNGLYARISSAFDARMLVHFRLWRFKWRKTLENGIMAESLADSCRYKAVFYNVKVKPFFFVTVQGHA